MSKRMGHCTQKKRSRNLACRNHSACAIIFQKTIKKQLINELTPFIEEGFVEKVWQIMHTDCLSKISLFIPIELKQTKDEIAISSEPKGFVKFFLNEIQYILSPMEKGKFFRISPKICWWASYRSYTTTTSSDIHNLTCISGSLSNWRKFGTISWEISESIRRRGEKHSTIIN